MEVEDFQNYEKAMGALTEAYKTLSKALAASSDTAGNPAEGRLQQKTMTLKLKIMLCKQFVETQL